MIELIREEPPEIFTMVLSINHAYQFGEFDHFADPLGERDRLISQYLTRRLDRNETTPEETHQTLPIV